MIDKYAGLTNADISMLIDSYIRGRNADRNRQILKMRLLDGMTFEHLAESVDMSERQIKNIVYSCELVIVSHIQEVLDGKQK